MNKRIRWFWVVAIIVGFVQMGWSQTPQPEKVTVFAAASLTNALQEIANDYQKATGVTIISSFASSSTLARQLTQGAPADVFISADQTWMDFAKNKQAIDEKNRVTLLGNNLVLVAAKSSTVNNVTLDDKTQWKLLLVDGRLAVGDPDHVPAGIYAKEALEKLGAWQTVSPLMARANDVRGALALVERGEAPLGIVYGSDAVVSTGVKVVGVFPENSHTPVEYPMAIVTGHETPVVQGFYRYLLSPQAAAVFKRYGFTPRHAG